MGNNASPSKNYSCQICSKILQKPILLSCKCNICKEHLNDLFTNKTIKEFLFECKKCNIKSIILPNNLNENVELNLQLDHHVYMSKSKRKLKSMLDEKLKEINAFIANLNDMKQREFSIKINDHFYGLINEIDIKRETVLQKLYSKNDESETEIRTTEDEIQRISAILIEKVELNEKEFCRNFNQEVNLFLNEFNLDECQKRIEETFRGLTLTKTEIKKLIKEYEIISNSKSTKLTEIRLKFDARLRENKFREYGLSAGIKKGNTSFQLCIK